MQAAAVVPPQPRPISSVIPATRAKFLIYSSSTTEAIKKRQLQFSSVNYRRIEMATTSPSPASVGTAPKWAQKTITIPAQRRGCHLITSKILKEIGQDLSGFKCGLAHFFHPSAYDSAAHESFFDINENYDSDVHGCACWHILLEGYLCVEVLGLRKGPHHGSILWKDFYNRWKTEHGNLAGHLAI